MRYALVNGEVREAVRGLSGECRGCGRPMLARCGNVRVKHWAHKGELICDPWLKDKTEWHITWQDHFPTPWQEYRFVDESGEMHIADVKTADGWAIEFQHSRIDPSERKSRNAFYPKLVWVVDGFRRKRYQSQFKEALTVLTTVNHPIMRKVCMVRLSEGALLRDWEDNPTPVFIDFGEPDVLWCMAPRNSDGKSHVVEVPRQAFIDYHRNGTEQSDPFSEFIKSITAVTTEIAAILRTRAQEQASHSRRHFDLLRVPNRSRRRF